MVCVGGGRGERFGGDKLAADLGGITVLEASLGKLRAAFAEAPLAVVLPAATLEAWRGRLAERGGHLLWVCGGARRQDSVRAGVEAVAGGGIDVVLVHDAARPLVSPGDVRRVVAGLGDADGAILCGQVVDTVKRVDASGAVVGTVDRGDLRLAQTPQVFRLEALRRAWRGPEESATATDEAMLLEAVGMRVQSVLARRPNPKLTLPEDLELLRRLAGGER